MPIIKQQTTNIIKNITSELEFLKEFLEKQGNQSIPLLDLINLGKSKGLINKTPNLQKIFLQDEDLRIQQAILDLFEQDKNKGLKKELTNLKKEFEKFKKLQLDSEKINLIKKYKENQDTPGQIKYIYSRILYREDSIVNLMKLKLLTDIIGENETSGYIGILQNKFSEQGRTGPIAFIHLNNIFDEDTEKELKLLGDKKPIKRKPIQAAQPEQATIVESTTTPSSHLDFLPDSPSSSIVSSPKDKNSEKVVEQPSEFLPSWEIFAKQQEHIDDLKKTFEFIKKDYDILHTEKTELQEEITKLQNIKERLETEKSRIETRYKILEVKGITQSNKEKVLTEQKEKADRKLLETERVLNELQKNANELQSKYDAQNFSLETISSELESAKKLLQETQTNLSQKEIQLEEIDIQLKETKETANQLKNLQPDLNAANKKVNQLKLKQNNLETEIATFQAENKRLNTELQENQVQKAKLENTLKNLGNTQSESENQKKLFEATETIKELLESNKIIDEKEILLQNLTQAQEKIGVLESEIHSHQNKLKGLSENTLADNQQISALKIQLDNLNKSNEETQAYIEELTVQKKDKEDALNEFTTELQSIKIELAKASQNNEQLNRTNQTLLFNNNSQLKSNEELDKEIATLKKSSDQAVQTIANLENEKENLKKALQLEQQKFSQAEDKKNNLQDKLDKLNKTDSSNQETISAFETQLDGLTTLKSEQDILIQSLEKKLKEKDQEIDSLSVENQQGIGELKQLNEKLTDTQTTFNKLEHEIIDLKAEQDEFKKKDSENKSKISVLENQIEKFDESYARDNESIEQLTAQVTTYENNIVDLEAITQKKAEELTDFKSKFQQLEIAKKRLEDGKLDLDEKISVLNQQNTELRGLLDQSADKDEFIIELERDKAQIEKQLMVAHSELETLNEKFKSNEKADSNLKDNYATLKEKFSEKNLELEQIKFELAAVKKQLEEVREKTKEQGGPPMPEKEFDLMGFEDPVTDPFHPKVSFSRPDDSTSSGRASGESLSPSPVFDDRKLENPLNSSSLDSLLNIDRSIDDPMNQPTQEEQDTNRLTNIKKGIIDAFKQENHQAIIEAFTKEFSQIATHAAESLQDDIDDVLPEFEDKLEETARDKITHLISQLHNKPNLLSPSIERIHRRGGIGTQTYLEEVTNLASFIFGNLQLEGGKNYMTHIEDTGKSLLINLCIENLQINEKPELLETAEMMLADKTSDNELQHNEYTETIKTTAEELVTKLLKKDNLLAVLKEASENLGELNLLAASKQKLQEQLEQQINQNFDLYFPDVHLNPILEKISNNIALSEEELREIPSELQYADTAEEFVNGLRLKYPKLSSNYENKISEEIFKKSRLILRKNASSAINITLPDELISDLTPELWLEKQLLLITGKPTKLEQIELEKDQKNLLNELDSALHLSTFYDIALTPKSIAELKAEIEKSNHAQLAAAKQANELFAEIENRQKEYLKISNDPVAGFLQKIEEETNTEILRFNPEGAKKLFSAIDTHLLKVGKWDYFNAKVFNYKLKDITNELLATIPNNDYEKDSIEKTIKYAIGFLCEKNSKDKLHKEQILKDIALFYASTKKLSTFNAEIANRKVKIENLFELKDKKDRETQTTTGNPSAAFAGIFLPHNCTIIADSFDPNLEILANSEFKMLTDTFYANNAMQIGQTITFEQKLSDNKSKEWSVTRNANSFAYNTSSWGDRLKNVGDRIRNKIDPFTSSQLSSKDQEVTYAAFQHAVASSKGPVLTMSIGANCSVKKEKYIRQLIEVFNQNSRMNGQKTTIFIDSNDKLKIHKDAKAAMKNEIDIKNSPSKELGKAAKQSDEALNRHTTTLRGRG